MTVTRKGWRGTGLRTRAQLRSPHTSAMIKRRRPASERREEGIDQSARRVFPLRSRRVENVATECFRLPPLTRRTHYYLTPPLPWAHVGPPHSLLTVVINYKNVLTMSINSTR